MPNEISRASPATAELCSIADDLLEGADAIATFIYGSPQKRRKVYHLAQTSNLPVFRFGAVLCARKSRILEWIESQEMQADTRVQRLEKARRTERINKILAAEKIGGRA
ncbi:MAG: DNA-binding protein [Proteobacteria bacterium]|nr:DNA-binding protein [Pseudomonadota bacterium]